jgi:hypothetical protein
VKVLAACIGKIRHVQYGIIGVAVDDIVSEAGVETVKVAIEGALDRFLGLEAGDASPQLF